MAKKDIRLSQKDVVKILKKEIRSNNLRIHEKFFSEKILGERFNLSKISIRNVLTELTKDNYIYSLKGVGTFISPYRDFNKARSTFDEHYSTSSILEKHDISIPDGILKKAHIPLDNWQSNKWESFVKIYMIKDRITHYSVFWVLKGHYYFNYDEVGSKYDPFENKFSENIKKVISISTIEKFFKIDARFLNIKNESLIPTTYKYYINEREEVRVIELIKYKREHFFTQNIKTL